MAKKKGKEPKRDIDKEYDDYRKEAEKRGETPVDFEKWLKRGLIGPVGPAVPYVPPEPGSTNGSAKHKKKKSD